MGALDRLQKTLTEKQYIMFNEWLAEKPIKLFASGGMRAGKTFALVLMFIVMIRRKQNCNLQFGILGGSIASIQRNVISVMEEWLGITIKIGKFNDFQLFGNKVILFGANDKSCVKAIRGCTLAGCFINEISVIDWNGVKEIQDRCSIEGAQILGDTNPCSLYENTYTEIFAKGNVYDEETGRCLQKCYHFTLLENTKLPTEYIKSQLQRYPEGTVDYERYILGKYANKEGLVYYMFNENKHVINSFPIHIGVSKYILGMDFGYGSGHSGSLVVIAKMRDGTYIVVDATVEEGKLIDFWKDRAIEYRNKYGCNVVYADYARPDLIQEMRKTRLNIVHADKSVLLGIDSVSGLLAEDKLFFMNTLPKICFEELARYSWETGRKEEPKKEWDNFLDGLRYGIYTERKLNDGNKGLYDKVKPKQFSMYK